MLYPLSYGRLPFNIARRFGFGKLFAFFAPFPRKPCSRENGEGILAADGLRLGFELGFSGLIGLQDFGRAAFSAILLSILSIL